MAYDTELAYRIRKYLSRIPLIKVHERKMFGGLAFIVNDKMCVNASRENLMCRFDPLQTKELEVRKGFLPMTMKGKKHQGYCYVQPEGFKDEKDFEYWMNLCLKFNERAIKSK
ncbi:MAG TPA: TfoX/Sxy family protein [Cytophagaceae bacterium]